MLRSLSAARMRSRLTTSASLNSIEISRSLGMAVVFAVVRGAEVAGGAADCVTTGAAGAVESAADGAGMAGGGVAWATAAGACDARAGCDGADGDSAAAGARIGFARGAARTTTSA